VRQRAASRTVEKHSLVGRMSCKGNCWDNAVWSVSL